MTPSPAPATEPVRLCACPCGQPLTGTKTRWASPECKRYAQKSLHDVKPKSHHPQTRSVDGLKQRKPSDRWVAFLARMKEAGRTEYR